MAVFCRSLLSVTIFFNACNPIVNLRHYTTYVYVWEYPKLSLDSLDARFHRSVILISGVPIRHLHNLVGGVWSISKRFLQ